MKCVSLLSAVGVLMLAALPASADLLILSTDRSWSTDVLAEGGSPAGASDSTLLPGHFNTFGTATSTNTGDGSVFGIARQNSTTPNVLGHRIFGVGIATMALRSTVTAETALSKSLLDVTFTPIADTQFDLASELLTSPNPAFAPSLEFKLEDTTSNTVLMEQTSPTPFVFLLGAPLKQGDVYRIRANVSVDGGGMSHAGEGATTVLGAWFFELQEVPEPGSMALFAGFSVAGALVWRRRRYLAKA